MSQQANGSFPIDPFTTSGIDLAGRLNELNEAMISSQSGTSRPAYAVQSYVWTDITNSINAVRYYTGAVDLSIISYDVTKNKALVTGGASFSDTSKAILIKSSATSLAVPLAGDLEDGEIAINIADKILYFKDDLGAIASISNPTSVMAGVGFDHYGLIAPVGALVCDGSEYSKTLYTELYAVIGDSFANTGGVASPSTGNFRIPPQQIGGIGLFNRGVGVVNGDVGQYEQDSYKEHSHSANHNHIASSNTTGNHSHSEPSGGVLAVGGPNAYAQSNATNYGTATTGTAGNHSHTITVNTKTFSTGNSGNVDETRPHALTVLKCIWTGK